MKPWINRIPTLFTVPLLFVCLTVLLFSIVVVSQSHADPQTNAISLKNSAQSYLSTSETSKICSAITDPFTIETWGSAVSDLAVSEARAIAGMWDHSSTSKHGFLLFYEMIPE